MKKNPILTYNRNWSNMSLIFRVEQLKKDKLEMPTRKTFRIRRRSDYFYIQERSINAKVFVPDSIYREMWNFAVILMILYQNYIIFYILAYSSAVADLHFRILLMCDIFFLLELLALFNTGYFAEGVFIRNREKIIKTYLKTLFIPNFLASFPLQLFVPSMRLTTIDNTNVSEDEVLKVLWLLKLLNILKLPNIFNIYQCHITSQLTYTVFHLVKFLLVTLLVIHFITCFLYYSFIKDLENTGMMWVSIYDTGRNVYLRYFYMAVMTMTSTGYGDIVPFSTNQKLLTIAMMAISCWLFAFVLSNSKDILLKYTAQDSYYREVKLKMKKYMKNNNISRDFRLRIISYLHYLQQNSKKSTLKDDDILNSLSEPLKEEVFIVTRGNLLDRCPVFRSYSLDFLRVLIRSFSRSIYAPKDIIIKENENTDSIFFIITGRVEIYHEKTQTVFKELDNHKYFGELAFMLGVKRTCSVRSLVYSEVLFINGFNFAKILSKRPKDLEFHRLIVLQAELNIGIIGVRCYLCNDLGHIAKDCKQFVILIDEKTIAYESNNRRYSLNKRIKKPSLRLSVNPKGNYIIKKRIDPVLSYKQSDILSTKCLNWLEEDRAINIKSKPKKKQYDSESSEEEASSIQGFLALPDQQQFTSNFLKRRISKRVIRFEAWKNDEEQYFVTFGNLEDGSSPVARMSSEN